MQDNPADNTLQVYAPLLLLDTLVLPGPESSKLTLPG